MDCNSLMKELELTWNKSLTPTWHMDFLETIADSYKSTRGELKSMESHQLSEYHQEMFYHHYGIATKMKNRYLLGKLDLDRTQKFLNCCLKDYENIAADDRDNSLEDFCVNVNELLQEVNADIDKLSTSLPDLKCKEFVETCLALGNIDNNSEMLSHLAECSQEEKKHLEQLLRSTQLVRLVVSLEESALFQTFRRAAMSAENETCLSRAYHLAKYGKQMKHNSMNAKSNQQEDEETVLYGNVKQRVQMMIESEIVENKLSLEQMKLFIARNIGKELSVTDAAFVEDEYKEICIDQCMEEVTNSMKAFLRSHGEIDITNILKLMEHMATCEDFPDYFKSLDYLKELLKLSLNENEERCIVKHFKTVCLEHIDDYCNAVKSELGLLSCLKSYLSHSRHVRTALNRLGLAENTSKVDFNSAMNITDQENDDQLTELKCMVGELQSGNRLIIEDKLIEAIRSFVDPVQVKVDGREIVEVIGKHVVLSEVLEKIEKELANDFGISEVRIIGEEVFHIDADLVHDLWHGKNVAVRSKLIIVHGTVVWDVSGKSNQHKFNPARSASTVGGEGSAGLDGFPGECGGNVLILTEQMRNCEAFTIASNGGNGSDGQDGGNGYKGPDGVGITKEELEKRFKSPVRFFATSGMRSAEARRIMRSIERDFTFTNVREIRSSEIFTEVRNSEGQKITFSYCEPKILQNLSHCYLLYKGSLGKAGGQGGDFGRGGQGGFPGQIAVKSIATGEMFNVTKQSARGHDGRPGVPGLYGNMGSNGWDMGYLDYQCWSSPVYHGEDYLSKFTITYHDDSKKNSVWCWRMAKYASITPAVNKNNSHSRHQVRQFGKRNRMQSACAVTKKTIIESSFIADYDKHFTTVEETLLLIQNIQRRAMEGSAEQRKKTNEKQKIHHIISVQNIEQDLDEPLVIIPNTAKRRGLKSTTLLNSVFKVDLVINWRQLKHCQIEKSDLIAKFDLLHSANIPEKDLLNIKQNLTNKYKLLIFEQLSETIYTENNYSDKTLLASKYTSICLEEDSQQSGLTWHDILGTLDEYLYNFTDENQQKKLTEFCSLQGKHLLPSVAQSFLLEEEFNENENPFAQSYLDHYKIFSELQDYDSTNYLEYFMQELIQSTYPKVLYLWCHSEERSSLVPKLMHEINRDYRLGNLHSRYVKCRNKTFNWEQCLHDEQFLEAFRTLIVKKGPLTRCYRELLAFAFGVNIQIYARDCCGRLSLQDSHNTESNEIVYFLLQNETFIKLSLNENLMKLEDDRRCRARKCSQISEFLMSLEDKRSIDNFMENFDWNVSVSSDKEGIDNGDLTDQLLKYFSFGERHSLEKLLNRSDVSNSVYSKLLRNILFRFDAEGIHVSTDEIYFLVNQYLVASNIGRHEETLLSWIILAYPQGNWISEVLLLQLEKYFRESLENKFDWRLYLAKVENKSLLILLSAKLDLNNPRNKLATDKIDGILRLLYLSTAKPETLQQLDLSEWFYLLEELYWTEKLQQIARWKTDCQKFKEASYYTVSLLNNYGFEILEQLFGKLAQKCAKDVDIVDVLWNVYNGRCLLTDESIARLDTIGVQDWIKEIKSQIMDYKERGIATLVKLIEDNKNASGNILQNLENIKKNVQKINRDRGIAKNLMLKEATNVLNNIRGKIFNNKNPFLHSFSTKPIVEKLKDIDDAINEIFNFRLRNTQKLAILALLENDKNTLAQVATGEGKSLIVVAVAIIKAALGQKVDIITSSSVLARRDAEQSKSIYAKFDIDVSHNCNEDIEKRKEAYSKNQVVYGDLSSFQRDYLLHNFYQKNVLGDRNFVNVIVDEVDSMLLDRGNNMLYLAHDLPDMDKLESVYVFIWQWVNNSSKKLDMAVIRDAVLWQIYGIIKPDDVGKLDAALDEEQRSIIWNKLIEVEIIDDEGKLMTDTINKDILADVLGSDFSKYLDRLEYLLKECINREKCIFVPNYLRSFIDLHLKTWIEAAKMALVMEAGQDYVVDVDRSGSSADRTPNITILDRDTGTDMVNSQWEAALHQFVQLKHSCKTYLQSLKAVFISNVKYFKMYQHLYGLSGTLGSHRERDLLEEIYDVDFINIPTAKLKLFHEDAPIVCQNVTDWTNAIIKSTRNKTNRKPKAMTESTSTTAVIRHRSVLIICETLNEVTRLYKAFGGTKATNVRTYTREYEEFDVGELPEGQIIIATNLAGRGTDIKLTPELRKAGGVHVCLTYLPTNIRVEQQAFGRAARCGDRGSGQLIVLDPSESRNILQLKRERDTRELSRISQIKKYYETRVVLEENSFSKFTEQYDMLRKLLTSSDVTKRDEDLREILLSSVLDRWVFWLDKNEKNLVTDIKSNSHRKLERSLDVFLNHLKSLNANSHESLLEWVDASVPRMVKLGRFLMLNKQRNLACTLFKKIIDREPHFSEAAHYYYAYAQSEEINWKFVDSVKVEEFTQALRSAANLYEERIHNITSHVSLIDRLKTNLKDNILPITAYKEQKQIICKLYDSLSKSIDDILGHPVSATSFFYEDIISKSMSVDIFKALLAKKILQNPTLKDTIGEEELRGIGYSYGTSAAKLKRFLEKCSKDQGRSVQFEEFVRLLKEQLQLPSREGFWRYLLGRGFLKSEVKYVLVDKTKLSYNDMKFLDAKVSQIKLPTRPTVSNGELFLYPDLLLEGSVYDKVPFKNAIGLDKYATFKEIGAISFQRKAKLDLETIEKEQVNFDQYDSVSLEDFALINISLNDASEILDLLVNGLILKRQTVDADVYVLRTADTKIKNFRLGSYKMYEEDVRDLLNMCFCYRIAFQSIISNTEEKRFQDITLISKPHRRIMVDLLCARVIEPSKVSNSFAEAEETKYKDVFEALAGLKLDQNCQIVVERLKNLNGHMDYLKMVPFPENVRYTNVEEWNLFSLNGNELLLKVKSVNFFKIALTFIWGVIQIGTVLMKNFNKHRAMRVDLNLYRAGWSNICSAIQMAFATYSTDYLRHKLNNVLSRVANFEAKYFGLIDARARFAFKVSQPVTRDIQRVRRLAVPLIRGFDIAVDSANVKLLIEDRLRQMCTDLCNGLLSTVDKSDAFSNFEDCLKKVVGLMGLDDTKTKLGGTIEAHLKRKQYFDSMNTVFKKVVESILWTISKATKRANVHKSIATILSDEIYEASIIALRDNEPSLAKIVNMVVFHLSENVKLKVERESNVDPTQSTDSELFIKEVTNDLKKQLREKLDELMQQTIQIPILERGSYLLLNYAERQFELQYSTEDSVNPGEDFAKKLRVEQLKTECEERRRAQAMTPIEKLLDKQFNEALAYWERQATELQRLAVQIRRGEPVDGKYLEPCLDAVRFVLLRRAVVVSNICVNLVTESGANKTISSPRNFNGIAVDLHLENSKFLVGLTHKTPPKSIPSLYDCLRNIIFELKSITPKQFAREISQHLINLSENKTNSNSTSKSPFDFNRPSTFKELCFAQFLQACFENTSNGVQVYGSLMERAKNGKNRARDWHGTGGAEHVVVITIHDSEQFVEVGFRRSATTDTTYGRTMSDLREAFFKVFA